MPMGGNMNNMLKQAQKMQRDMEKAQEELEAQVLEVSSAGGTVTVTITGKKEIQSIKLDPSVVDPEDVEMLEDILTVAVNEAIAKVNELTEKAFGGITGGMGMPFM